MGELAAALVLDRTALNHNLKPLVRDGYLKVAVDENDARADAAGEAGALFRSGGPAEESAVGVGGVGGGEDDNFAGVLIGVGAERAQEINGGRHGELGGAEVGGEVSAADAAAFFEGLHDVVDGGETARKIFGVSGFAEDDSVAREELLRDGV